MRSILSLLFSTLLFCSCKEKINSVQDVMNALEPEKQSSSIDPTVDNVIKGEKGTHVFIPSNSLKFKDGTTPTGKVNIELKEFFSVSDFISRNLSSVSENSLLETGGMIYITANSDGRELQLDKTKSLAISFPNGDSTKQMETFYGDTTLGTINWRPGFGWGIEGDALAGLDSTLLDSSMFETKTRVCGYVYSSLQDGSNFIIEWKLKHPDSTIFLYVNRNFPEDDTVVINALCKQGLIVAMDIYLSPDGKISVVEFDKHHSKTIKTPDYLRKYVTTFLKSLPPFDMKVMKSADPGEGFHLSLCCHRLLNREEYDRRFKKKYSQYLDKTIQEMGKEALNYYIISSGRLGWINCDRFLDDSTEKIDYIVKTPNTNDSKVMIVFDDIKSIMNGEIKNNEAIFRNVPVSSKIKVIGISYKDGKPLMSKMPAIVSRVAFTLTGFKEFTLKELEKELNN